MRPLPPLASCLVGVCLPGGLAAAAPVVFDNFDNGTEGRFSAANPGTASGTNRHVTAATADLNTATPAQAGAASQLITITPTNPGTAVDFPTNLFRLRHLSGGGTPGNNVNIGADGYVGFFLKTTTPGLTVAIGLDDGTGLEQGVFRNVDSSGQWTLYQWNLDAAEFTAFAGSGQNGLIDSSPVTVDSIFIQGPVTSAAPIQIYLDTIAHNTTGDLSSLVPEPSAIALGGVAVAAMLGRGRRRV